MYIQLNNYIIKLQILNPIKYEFHRNHSTHLATIDMCDNIAKSLDGGKAVFAIFIDLSKAFDTINHNILLDKLNSLGIPGIALQWFKSYLTLRTQYINLNNINSTNKLISCLVPQGSILGPLQFLLCINDMSKCSNLFYFILLADDTDIFLSDNNLNNLIANTEFIH